MKILKLYKKERISIGKAAEIAEITVGEMMQEAASHNLGSTETVQEFRESLKKLLN